MTDFFQRQPHVTSDMLSAMIPVHGAPMSEPEGVFVPTSGDHSCKVAVIYARGRTPPTITILSDIKGIQTVCADGVAVAVVASSEGPDLSPDDVMLIERYVNERKS
jgi:hypothetical protein